MSSDLSARLDRFLGRLEQWLPPELTEADWNEAVAFRWRKRQSLFGNIGYLAPVRQLPPIHLSDLHNIERQKAAIVANTRQFVRRLPANNLLLTGARGTGKSSLIKACLNEFVNEGLRLVEVDKDDLADLGDIVERLASRPERFAIFCDDLSFEDGESGYKALEVGAGRLGGGAVGQRADLRHFEPAPPAARVHEGQRDLPAHLGR